MAPNGRASRPFFIWTHFYQIACDKYYVWVYDGSFHRRRRRPLYIYNNKYALRTLHPHHSRSQLQYASLSARTCVVAES